MAKSLTLEEARLLMNTSTFEGMISELSHAQALQVLKSLGAANEMRCTIDSLAKALLKDEDEEKMANGLYRNLNMLDVTDLWERSGKSYYGYQDPGDVAFEMLEACVLLYDKEIEKYRRLGLKAQEKACFRAIIFGLLRYEAEGNNEFRNWVPDDVSTIIDNEFYSWSKAHPETEISELKKEFDGYFEAPTLTIEEFRKLYSQVY